MKTKIVAMSMRDQLYDALRELILKNGLAPNSILQIDRLAEDYGVSATPVREALVRLEGDGLVILIPNKGAQVTDIQAEDIRNNWEMRLLLEPYAAGQSVNLIPEAEIEGLESEIEEMRKKPFDNDKYIECDTKLHDLLYSHLSNSFLKDILRRVHHMSIRIRYFPEGSSAMNENVVQEVIQEHLLILGAIRTRDALQTSELVKSHLRNGEARAMKALAGKE